jgi:hypothetical protein
MARDALAREKFSKRCAPAAGDWHLELYKSSMKYDGKIGRELHGFPPPKEQLL